MPYSDTVPIEAFVPSNQQSPLSDKLKHGYPITDAIDWFWRNFCSDQGESLYSTLIEPLTGDFNRIAENGKAWKAVSKAVPKPVHEPHR